MTRTIFVWTLLTLAPLAVSAQSAVDQLVNADKTSIDAARRPTDTSKRRASQAFDGGNATAGVATRIPLRTRGGIPVGPSDSGGPILGGTVDSSKAAANAPEPKGEKNVTPYQNLVNIAQILLAIGAILLLAAKFFETGPYAWIGKALKIAAAALGAAVIAIGIMIMSQSEQKLQSIMLLLGGGALVAGALMSLASPAPTVTEGGAAAGGTPSQDLMTQPGTLDKNATHLNNRGDGSSVWQNENGDIMRLDKSGQVTKIGYDDTAAWKSTEPNARVEMERRVLGAPNLPQDGFSPTGEFYVEGSPYKALGFDLDGARFLENEKGVFRLEKGGGLSTPIDTGSDWDPMWRDSSGRTFRVEEGRRIFLDGVPVVSA